MTDPVRVLVVDDDLTNRLVLRALLKESGYASVEAGDGEQAVAAIHASHIDIVLMDVMMPVMDGYQAARLIKDQAGYFIPIIFLTAMSDEKSLARCIESGGDDFLTKPYNHIILRAKIESMLRIARLYKKIESQNVELNRHNARVQQEINVSKKVFSAILNMDAFNRHSGFRYSMSPMSIFNGDMILVENNHTNGLDVMISDFTGHGLSAAIGSIPVADIFNTMTRKGFSFSETLAECNNKLKKLLPTQMFMAAAFISIDRNNNVATVVNCGLPDVYLYRDGKIVKAFKSLNLPMGIVTQSPDNFSYEMVTLHRDDRIIAMTDGIIEARNSQGEFYGKQRLLSSIAAARSPDSLFDKVLNDCVVFSNATDQQDDVTLVEICHKEYVKECDTEEQRTPLKGAQWSMQFSLDIQSLRNFDILPYVMQGVNGLQSIPNGRSTIHTILTEMYVNALDHGVLKLNSAMKNSPEGYLQYYQEKQARLETMEEGNIQIVLAHELKPTGGGRLTIHVIDSGEGFDHAGYSMDLSQNKTYAGRGMALISQLCKEVKFLGKGNTVMAIYEWD